MKTLDLNTINYEALEKAINHKIGIPIKFDFEIYQNRSKKDCIELASQDIKNFTGCMLPLFKEVKLCSFGGGIPSQDENKKDFVWFSINYSFKYKRGSNGIKLMDAWYYFDTSKWIIRYEDEENINL